jgi:AcrR family transcriptional regulator
VDKREQILDATARVLARKGLAGATTRAITTEAGCAEGTLYLYFKGRAELFLALFERHLSTAFPDSAELLGEKKDVAPEAVLLDVALAFLRFHREVGPLLAALFAEPALLKRYRALIVSRNPDLPRASPAVVAYLREQQRRKRVAAHVDAAVVAEALLGACFARAFHDNMFDHVPPAPADRKFLRALIRGLL